MVASSNDCSGTLAVPTGNRDALVPQFLRHADARPPGGQTGPHGFPLVEIRTLPLKIRGSLDSPVRIKMFAATAKWLAAWRGKLSPLGATTADEAARLDDIRQAMLEGLAQIGRGRFPHVEQRILLASNVAALWFLRPELLMVLAAQLGEQAAREVIDEITEMFQGLLPKSLHTRPAGLQR